MPEKEHHKKEDHLKEIKEEHQRVEQKLEEKKKIEIEMPKVNLWMFATGLLAVILIAYVIFSGSNQGTGFSGNVVSANACGQNIISYINNNLVQPGTTATFVSSTEESGLYRIVTSYQGSNVSVYASKDCVMLFLSAVNTTIQIPTTTVESTTIPKTAAPNVDLYVMAFCPYGVQAEQLMKPVVDLFGNTTKINVRFIASVGGNTTESVSSLHGLYEAKEDLRQVCIMKYYPTKYWNYVSQIDDQCYSIARDETALDACWKKAASNLSMNTTQIETCAYGSEGLALLKADETLSNQNGVSGSPTLIINGVTYNGARSSEGFKQAICSAFTTAPSVCNQTVNASTATASGSC